MNTYDDSTRARYWREEVPAQVKSRPWFPLMIVFILAIVAMANTHPGNGIFIFILAIVFGSYLYPQGNKKKNVMNAPWNATPTSPGNVDMDKLFATLEQLEKRLVNLEAIVTHKEFDWERRLNQDPPAAKPVGSPSAPA